MRHHVGHEELMRYMDDELSPAERERIEAHLAGCTECGRELAIFRGLQDRMAELSFAPLAEGASVWDRVNRRIARPLGWAFLIVGVVAWATHALYSYVTSPAELWTKLGGSAVLIGLALLFFGVARDRLREWRTDPYREIER